MDVASAERGAARVWLVAPGDSLTEYTVDGERVDAARAKALKPEEIAAVEVTKRGDASGAHSSVRITTREFAAVHPGTVGGAAPMHVREVVTLDGNSARTFDGVVLIDGVRSTRAALQALDPKSIVTIDIIKGPAAAKRYDAPEAANGVIRITTKNGKK